MTLSPGQQRFVYPLLGVVCLVLSLIAGWSAYGNRINHIFYDLYFRQRGPQPVSGNIVIVGIDDATLAEYGPPPLDRSRLAEGIELLRQAQPRLIALDVLLSDPGDRESDQALEHALANQSRLPFYERYHTRVSVRAPVGHRADTYRRAAGRGR